MSKKTNQQKKKDILTERAIQLVDKYMKMYSTLLVLKEIQIKTTKRYSYTHTRMADIKDTKEAKH